MNSLPVPRRQSLSWLLRMLNVRFTLDLIFIWIHLQCAYGHQTFATPTSRQLFGPRHPNKYRFGDLPPIGSRAGKESIQAESASKWNGLENMMPTRELIATRGKRGGQSEQIYADSNNNNRTLPDTEMKALLAFKAALTRDPLDALTSWGVVAGNDSDTCRGWVGVTCSPQLPSHVVALNLSSLQLVGAFDAVLPSLGQLQFLQSVDLSVNVFTGAIQGESLSNFSRLSYFNVSQNLITGEIPSEIRELVSLEDFDVSQNNLTGLIPRSLGNCSSLRSIDVALNVLEGDIPASLGTLSRLLYFNISGNSLSGSIPGALGNCSSLRQLDVTDNIQLRGVIPPEMSGLTQFQVLEAGNCALSGEFPAWIVNLTSLIRISLLNNGLRGEIPDTIGRLPRLVSFDLGENLISGVIPLSVCNLTSLLYFSVIEANLTGHIPQQIGALVNLEELVLTGNNLSGVIPSSLANCSALSHLGLGINLQMDLQPVPQWIGSLTNLTELYLTGANLEGALPEHAFGMLSKLQILALAVNYLSGPIPPSLKNCSSLYVIDLAGNELNGSMPSELGELSDMLFFSVAGNYFTAPFPTFVSNWSQLSKLQLQENYFSGPLDGRLNIDQLGQLLDILVGSNNFNGPIPKTLGNSSSINYLDLSGNFLSGVIPAWLGNMTNLQLLFLGTNNLTGQIPVDFLTSDAPVTGLDLAENDLDGNIPFEIGLLAQLELLYLSTNKLTGVLPSSLWNCTKMGYLYLSKNQFEGNISEADISRVADSLLVLDLSHNLFSGSWPREISTLSSVQSVDVSFNNLSGSIPLGLGQCHDLQSLDVSSNNLTGAIPADLELLKFLEDFNASYNDFTGAIPHFNSTQINASSFLGNPDLCYAGSIVGEHQECAAVPQNLTATHREHCNGFNCNHVWIPVAVVSSVVLVVTLLVIMFIRSRWSAWMGGRYHKSDPRAQVILNFGTHRIKLSESDILQAMIDGPHGENVIGRGNKSIVYKGVLLGGREFALKKILPESGDSQQPQGDVDMRGTHPENLNSERSKNSELLKEGEILAKLRHKNIVMCLSFYSSLDHKALILEYMSGGSLHQHLHGMETCTLAWHTRLKIAEGVAQGMKYLHHDFPEPLIHRDLKPSNVLLDADFEAKVSDFGISKFVGARKEEATASTFCGTIGYMPPEYASQPWVSTKGDVYSYGMVLLELLTQKQPSSAAAYDDQGKDLRSWVLHSFNERPFELLDRSLTEECRSNSKAMEQMTLLLRVGLFCTRVDPQSRPSMLIVVGMLTHIVSLGAEPVVRRTMEELVMEDSTPWAVEDPSIEGAQFCSSF